MTEKWNKSAACKQCGHPIRPDSATRLCITCYRQASRGPYHPPQSEDVRNTPRYEVGT